jgi:hypothetical protein
MDGKTKFESVVPSAGYISLVEEPEARVFLHALSTIDTIHFL